MHWEVGGRCRGTRVRESGRAPLTVNPAVFTLCRGRQSFGMWSWSATPPRHTLIYPAVPTAPNHRDDTRWVAVGMALCFQQLPAFRQQPCCVPNGGHSLVLLGCLFCPYRSALTTPHLPPPDTPRPSSAWPALSSISRATCE